MTIDQILLALVLGAFACIGRMALWIYQHSKHCHAGPAADAAALEQRVSACEEMCKSNRHNWHELRRQMGPVYLWLQYLLEKLGINVTVLPAPIAPDEDEDEDSAP
jgi:hypothetical protein